MEDRFHRLASRTYPQHIDAMLAYAAECVQAERERAAKVCESKAEIWAGRITPIEASAAYKDACKECAAAIRDGK